MNTCDTCKWWDKFENNTRSGLCNHEHTNAVEHVRLYRLDGVLYDDWKQVPEEGRERAELIDSLWRATSPSSAYATDGHDIFGVETGPKYGCVHHKPK